MYFTIPIHVYNVTIKLILALHVFKTFTLINILTLTLLDQDRHFSHWYESLYALSYLQVGKAQLSRISVNTRI